jgi:hypothetical protein
MTKNDKTTAIAAVTPALLAPLRHANCIEQCPFILEDRKSAGRAQDDAIDPKARSLQQLESNRKSNIKIEFT